MDGKNKVMLVAAIGAVVILIASSVVRCSLMRAQDEAGQGESAAIEQDTAEEPGEDKDLAALSTLESHAWQVDGDPSRTIVFKDSTFVESDGKSVRLTAFEVTSSTKNSIDVKMTRDGSSSEITATISIAGGEGSYRVSCDAFQNATSYVQGSASKEPVAIDGMSEPYTTLIDGKTDQLASAVAEYCRAHVPTATKASFDGEAVLHEEEEHGEEHEEEYDLFDPRHRRVSVHPLADLDELDGEHEREDAAADGEYRHLPDPVDDVVRGDGAGAPEHLGEVRREHAVGPDRLEHVDLAVEDPVARVAQQPAQPVVDVVCDSGEGEIGHAEQDGSEQEGAGERIGGPGVGERFLG